MSLKLAAFGSVPISLSDEPSQFCAPMEARTREERKKYLLLTCPSELHFVLTLVQDVDIAFP